MNTAMAESASDNVNTAMAESASDNVTNAVAPEVRRYGDLGLGRGVDATIPDMWGNKSAFLVREVEPDASNVITDESGCLERYEKEVCTTSARQLKIRLSLDDSNSQVKLGMDAHSSQSTTSMKKIAGTKLHTRTIAFRSELSDLSHVSTAGNRGGPDNAFESRICSWILDRSSQRRRTRGFKDDSKDSPSVKLVKHIKDMKRQNASYDKAKAKKARKVLRGIAVDFQEFFNQEGTHYVSAIELGAMKYSVSTLATHQTKVGVGAELEAVGRVSGGISGVKDVFSFLQSKEEQEIGRIVEGYCCRRNTADEAVIGFQIRPIFSLVRKPLVHYITQKLMKEYIIQKTDKSSKFCMLEINAMNHH